MSLVQCVAFNERGDIKTARQFPTEQSIKDFLKMKYANGYHFGTDGLLRYGHYREMAIDYDFTPWLKRFLIRQATDGYLHDAWAPNKTLLRQAKHLSRNDTVYLFPSA